jgi:hypothetical protein
MFKQTLLIAALACTCGVAQAQTTDDFNRDDAPDLGENYTIHHGKAGTAFWSAMGSDAALATYNGSSGNHATLDVATDGYVPGSYAALVFGYLSGNDYFIKVQDSDGDGWFESLGFMTGNNESLGELKALNPFMNGTLEVTLQGTTASLTVWTEQPRFGPGAKAGGDGWIPQTYTFDYGFAAGSGDVGLGLEGLAIADNFSFGTVASGVPEPASWAMLILGAGFAGAGLRARRSRVAFA